MGPFRFRAAAALDLRRKQDDEAQRALAVAAAAVTDARRTLTAAEGLVAEAMDQGRSAQESATDAETAVWYRNWIMGRQHEVERCREALVARRAEEARAIERANRARRDVRVLERFRDRLLRAYQRDVRREEQKELDMMGSLRHAARQIAREHRS